MLFATIKLPHFVMSLTDVPSSVKQQQSHMDEGMLVIGAMTLQCPAEKEIKQENYQTELSN